MGQRQFRVSSSAEAQWIVREHHAPDPRTVGDLAKHAKMPKVHHYGKHTGLDSNLGGGFEVQLPEFNAVVLSLAEQCNEFMQALEGANGLASKLPDGSGPIASIVGHAFNHRLGAEGGMRYAMRTHVEHLTRIVTSLQQMASTYQEGEEQAKNAISDAGQGGN